MASVTRFLTMVFLTVFLAAETGVLCADTPTDSPSPTDTLTASPTGTFTATPTVTPGSGSYSITLYNGLPTPLPTPGFLVPGNSGNSLTISYTTTGPFSAGGQLVFLFPADICATPAPNGGSQPNSSTFYAVDAKYNTGDLQYAFNGQAVTVTTNIPFSANTSLVFNYGEPSIGGFAVAAATTQTTEAFQIWANPQPQTTVPGLGLVAAPSPIFIYTATASPTITPTFTISLTLTQTLTPTPIESPSITPTFTLTTVGPVRPGLGFYTYPNPFDLRVYSNVTVRFDPTFENISISIFSLAGNPVREIPASAIQSSMGVAQWDGRDDYGRLVPGGLYFVRLKTPEKITVHKMTV